MKTLRITFFQSHVSKFDQERYPKFSYFYIGLGAGWSTVEAIDNFFCKALKDKSNIRLLFFFFYSLFYVDADFLFINLQIVL